MSMGAPGALGTGGGPSTANNRVIKSNHTYAITNHNVSARMATWQHGHVQPGGLT